MTDEQKIKTVARRIENKNRRVFIFMSQLFSRLSYFRI